MSADDPLKGFASDPLAGMAKADPLAGLKTASEQRSENDAAVSKAFTGTAAYRQHAAIDFAVMHPNPDDPYWNSDIAHQGFQAKLDRARQAEEKAVKEGHGLKAGAIDFARTMTGTVHDIFTSPTEHDVMKPEPGLWQNVKSFALDSPPVQAYTFTEHALGGIVGWVGGASLTALGEPQKGTQFEAAFHSASERIGLQGDSTTPGGHFWDPLYAVFTPLTALGQGADVTLSTDVPSKSPWMHYTREAVRALPMALAVLGGGHEALRQTKASDAANSMLHEQETVASEAPHSEEEIRTNERVNAASASQPFTQSEAATVQNVDHGMDGVEVDDGPPEDLTPEEQDLINRWKAAQREKHAAAQLEAETQRLSAHLGEQTAQEKGWRQAIDDALGPHSPVYFVHDEDGLPKNVRARLSPVREGKKRIGLHDSVTGAIYLLSDGVKSPEEAVWTAAHELVGHQGFQGVVWDKAGVTLDGVKPRDALAAERLRWTRNPVVGELSRAIAKFRGEQYGPIHAEEALAELAAADATGNWDRLHQLYGKDGFTADISPELRGSTKGMVHAAVSWLRSALQKLFGRPVSDMDVRKMLETMRRTAQMRAVNPDVPASAETGIQSAISAYRGMQPAETLTPRMYRESSPNGANDLLEGKRAYAGPAGEMARYAATHPELALGQGYNRGVLVQLDPKGFDARFNLSKPSAQHMLDTQGMGELEILPKEGTHSGKFVQSVTLKKGWKEGQNRGEVNRLIGNLRNLVEKHGWIREETPEGIEFRRPVAFEPAPEILSSIGEDGEDKPYTPKDALDFSDMDTLDQEFPSSRGARRPRNVGTRVWSVGQSGLSERGMETLAKMAEAEGSWSKGWKAMRTLMNEVRGLVPDAASPKNSAAASTIIDRIAGAKLEAGRYMRVLRSFHRAVAKLSPEQQMALWRLGEQGHTGGVALPTNADWAGLIRYIRARHDKAYETIGWARGYAPKYRKNHLARFVRRPDGMVYDSSVPPNLREAFENAREFVTTDEALNAGYQLVSPNIIDHEMRWAQSVQRFTARWSTLRELARTGIVRIVPEGYEAQPDEVLMQSPDRRSTMAVPAHVAQLLKNSVMHAPLTGPWARFWRGTKILGSSLSAPILAGNIYHGLHLPFFVAFPSYWAEESHVLDSMPWGPTKALEFGKAFGRAASHMVRAPKVGEERMSAGNALRLMSGKEGGASIDPITGRVSFPAEDPGDVALGVIRGTHDPAKASDPAIEAIRRLTLSGMDLTGQGEWRNAAWDRFREALDEQTASGYMKATGWFLPTFFRALAAPVMDWMVPRMKVRAFLHGAERWYEANPNKLGSVHERLALQALGREIEQRYGEMTTDNLLWNKYLTAALQGSMLSFSWNVSAASQLIGGSKDKVQNIYHILRGDDPSTLRHRSRFKYAVGYMAGGIFIGCMITKFIGGVDPKTLKDCMYPIVGDDDAGKPVRIKMPWLGNDFGSFYYHSKVGGAGYAASTLLEDKAAPALGIPGELIQNKNFYGQQIIQPLDPAYEKLGQAFRAFIEAEEPIPLQAMQHEHAQLHGLAKHLFDTANAMGISQAPSYVDQPIPVQQIYYLSQSQGFRGTEPYDRAMLHHAEYQYHLRDLYTQAQKTGNAVPFTRALTQFVQKNPMTQRQIESLVGSFSHPPGYSTLQELPEADQAYIMHNMESDPKLLLQYWGAFSDQVRATVDQATIDKLEALNNAQ